MLVCNVSLRPPRVGIAAEILEAIEATDATATGQVVFATLVDDPANVGDVIDAYLGEIMVEAASASDDVDGSIPAVVSADVAEAGAADSTQDASTGSAEVTAFLARTSGLDATHVNAYTALIDGLVADGIWAKLDVLHVYATQDSTTALLNLIGNIYNASSIGGALTFVADQGYWGDALNARCLRTGFTPSTASSPKFTQNSGHVSLWSLTNVSSGSALTMGSSGTGSAIIGMHIRFTGNLSYFYLNDAANMSAANASALGHFVANRSTSSATQGYKNGSSVVTSSSNTSVAVNSREIYVAGQNSNGTTVGAPYQVAMASIGSSLTAGEVTSFYNRLRTYMTAMGIP